MTKEQPLQRGEKPAYDDRQAPTKPDGPDRNVVAADVCDSVDVGGPTDAGETEQAVPRSLRRLTCLSVTNRTHSIDRVCELAPEDPLALARAVQSTDRVTEAMVLSTCNRIEVYVATRTPDPADREVALEAATDGLALPPDARVYSGRDVVTHLARVTAGIESAVLGEDEIVGQVSDALAAAKEAGVVAGVLDRVGNAALRAGRTCRAETDIGEGPAGYGSAVCRVIAEELGGAPGRVLIVGAGEMASTIARTVRRRWDVRIDVANRSPAHELTTECGTWWTLDDLAAAVGEADAVVTATGADRWIFAEAHARRCVGTVPVVDLATPPDVSAGARAHPNTSVTDLEELAAAVRSVMGRRRAAVAEAESVISDAVDRLVECERENRAEGVIRELHREAADVREAELDRAKQRLADGEAAPEEVLEDFASALTGRLLGPPTDELRTAARERDETALRAARRLFDVDGT
jgi:glutamyl-tRNA reductase